VLTLETGGFDVLAVLLALRSSPVHLKAAQVDQAQRSMADKATQYLRRRRRRRRRRRGGGREEKRGGGEEEAMEERSRP